MKLYGILFSILVIYGIYTKPVLSQISDQCLGCICYASTGCDRNIGCTDSGLCGPFLISWAFWSDAGKFVIKGTNPSDPNAFSTCAKDVFCASETIRSYMIKFGKDCTGEGSVTCEDYARIFKSGPNSCSTPNILETKFYQEFQRCQAQNQPQ